MVYIVTNSDVCSVLMYLYVFPQLLKENLSF